MARQKTATRKLADFNLEANPFNAVNRGVYIADNLDFLRSVNSASVDLVCIDPPFAKNDTFTADKLRPPLRKDEAANELRLLKDWGIATQAQADAAGVAWPDDPKAKGGYRDTWSWDEDVHPDWVGGIKATHEAVNMLIETTREIHGDSIAAYLSFMAIRLIEIHRILKPTGSLYMHCDHTASGYLRQLLDGVFGKDNFRNEIIWKRRQEKHNLARRQVGNIHDTIYWYARSPKAIYNIQFLPYSEEYIAKGYKLKDERGLYQTFPCTNEAGGNKPYEFRGITRAWRFEPKRMEAMYQAGLLVQATPDSPFRYKKYLEDADGVKLQDLWDDVGAARGNERTGYPTQKPIALAERIIKASTNPGAVVLDCFAGCAYTALAAEKIRQSDPEQERIWAACDINLRAWTVFKRQFNKGGDLPLLNCNDETTGQQVLGCEPTVTIHGPGQLPQRTEHSGVEVKPLRTDNRRAAGSKYRGGAATTLLGKDEMLRRLLGISYGRAWCCGYRSAGTDGEIIPGNYELDHITPKSKGGEDEIYNRAPLCPRHNGRKSNRDITLDELRFEVAFAGELAEGMTPQSLIRLDAARRQAMHIFSEEYQRQHGKSFI